MTTYNLYHYHLVHLFMPVWVADIPLTPRLPSTFLWLFHIAAMPSISLFILLLQTLLCLSSITLQLDIPHSALCSPCYAGANAVMPVRILLTYSVYHNACMQPMNACLPLFSGYLRHHPFCLPTVRSCGTACTRHVVTAGLTLRSPSFDILFDFSAVLSPTPHSFCRPVCRSPRVTHSAPSAFYTYR